MYLLRQFSRQLECNASAINSMKQAFQRAFRWYLRIGALVSLVFWVFMIYDDWIFVEKYELSAHSVWLWIRFYVAYVIVGFSICYWLPVCIIMAVYWKWRRRGE